MPLSGGRRGTSVAELLVALAVFGILSLAVVGVLWRVHEVYRIHTQQTDRRQTLRAAAAIFPTELRELDAADGDLVAMSATAITIRAPRQLGLLCRAQAPEPAGKGGGPLTLILSRALRYGVREFDAGTDSLWILAEGPAAAPERDRWLMGAVASVGSAPCADGTAGRRLTTTLDAPGVDGFAIGTPVLGFETVTYRVYRSSEDGRWYIGQQTATDFQPVIGPVTTGGFSLAYFDSSGAATSDPTRVRLIEVRVRAATNEPIRDASGRLGKPVDSVVTVVALRNNRAP